MLIVKQAGKSELAFCTHVGGLGTCLACWFNLVAALQVGLSEIDGEKP